MTLFNIIAWNNREEVVLAQSWQEAVDIFINTQNQDDDFNIFDIEHVIYADIFKADGVHHFVDGSLVAADGSYPYAAPWDEVLEYLASK